MTVNVSQHNHCTKKQCKSCTDDDLGMIMHLLSDS